jgi:hypothetical protein
LAEEAAGLVIEPPFLAMGGVPPPPVFLGLFWMVGLRLPPVFCDLVGMGGAPPSLVF